jgi:hypothetical protein
VLVVLHAQAVARAALFVKAAAGRHERRPAPSLGGRSLGLVLA